MTSYQLVLSRLGYVRNLSSPDAAYQRLILTLLATINPGSSMPPGPAIMAYLASQVGADDPAVKAIERTLFEINLLN